MKILTEREAGIFLRKKGFDVAKRAYVENAPKGVPRNISKEMSTRGKDDLKAVSNKLNFPWVMKVSGKEIVHKTKVGGVVKGIKDYETALKVFDKLKQIKFCEGVIIQTQMKGKEFLLGIKRTPEFGHVIAFGTGGIHTEKLKDVSFRVCPFNKKEVKKMFQEVEIGKDLDKNLSAVIEKNILKLCKLVREYPRIKELDINPLMQGKIIDSRIVFS